MATSLEDRVQMPLRTQLGPNLAQPGPILGPSCVSPGLKKAILEVLGYFTVFDYLYSKCRGRPCRGPKEPQEGPNGGPRMPKRGPQGAQDDPKTGPRRPQDGPGTAQVASKSIPHRIPKRLYANFSSAVPPRGSQEGPRTSSGPARTPPGVGPRLPQRGLKRGPRPPQEDC